MLKINMSLIGKNSSVEMYLRIRPTSEVIKQEEKVYNLFGSSSLLVRHSSKNNNDNYQNYSSRESSQIVFKLYDFTKIFGSETSQAEIFEQSIKHRVAELFNGKSSTIMTYGNPKSGKTYTLFGTSTSPGIIMRSIQLVFSKIRCYHLTPKDQDQKWKLFNLEEIDERISIIEARRFLKNSWPKNPDTCKECEIRYMKECENRYFYEVWISFIAIWDTKFCDLLKQMNLTAVKNDLFGHSSYMVKNTFDACKIFLMGQSNIKNLSDDGVPLNFNLHTIFRITLVKYRIHRPNIVAFNTLTFCDTAQPTRLENSISGLKLIDDFHLSVFHECLTAMSKNGKGPIYNSKLTTILQSALSGQENLSFIVNAFFSSNFDVKMQKIFDFCDTVRKLIDICKVHKQSDEVTSSEECDNNVILSPFIHQTSSETAEKATSTDYIDWEAYENIQEQNEKLMKELDTTKDDIVNREYAIRKELADHYSRMIEEMEAIYKKHTKDIETERRDLLKWSVELVENFYKERIDNLMRHKKRKRGDNDHNENGQALYEELENENAQVISKMMILRETMKKLRDENKTILCKKNKCSFELALITKELKKFRQLTRSRIQKWDSDTENDSDNLINNLERLMYGMIKMTEMKLEKINKFICATKDENVEVASKAIIKNQELSKSKNFLNDTLIKMNKLEEDLSCKEIHIVTLKDRIQMQERQLIEIQQCFNDIKNDNVEIQKCKCDRSTNISSHDYAVDNFFEHDNVLISSTKKNSLKVSSSTADKEDNFVDWIVVPKSFATPTHAELMEKKLSNISDIDRGSFFENNNSMDGNEIASRSNDKSNKDDSGVSSGLHNESRRSTSISDSTHIRENEDTQISLIDENTIATEQSADLKKQNHEETLRVTELSEDLKAIKDVIYVLNEAACVNERKIIQHEYQLLYEGEVQAQSIKDNKKIAIKRDTLSKMIKDKMQKYECEISELTSKLTFKEENEDRTFKCLDKYIERSKSLENKLSSMRNQLDKASDKCANEHLPKMENLEDEVLQKTLQINDLNEKIVQMQHKLTKGYELFEKIHDFEIIMKKCQRDKNELGRQLYECLETQLTLEDKLKELTTKMTERESKIISLKNEICNMTDLNRSNNEKTRNLSKQVIEASKSIDSAKKDLQCCKDLHKNVENVMNMQINFESCFLNYKNNTENKTRKTYDDSQNEIIHLKTQLEHKELEISRYKNSIDIITQKYDILVKHFQSKIKETDEQFETIPNNLNNLEKSFTENNALSEIIDSSHQLKPTEDPEQSIESFKVDETD